MTWRCPSGGLLPSAVSRAAAVVALAACQAPPAPPLSLPPPAASQVAPVVVAPCGCTPANVEVPASSAPGAHGRHTLFACPVGVAPRKAERESGCETPCLPDSLGALVQGAFSRELSALGAASLWAERGVLGRIEAYRLTTLPSFSSGATAVVVPDETGGARVSARLGADCLLGPMKAVMSRKDVGDITIVESRTLDAAEWARVRRCMDTGLWTGSAAEEHTSSDGMSVLMEGIRDGRYRSIDRSNPTTNTTDVANAASAECVEILFGWRRDAR